MMAHKLLEFKGQLYPFQLDVLKWSQQTDRGILGLDMGLGKTIISLAIMCDRQYQKVIIVMPLPVMGQWERALGQFTNLTMGQIAVYHGRQRKSMDLSNSRVILTTYDVVRRDLPNSQTPLCRVRDQLDGAIFDEVHKIRNEKTLTYEACLGLSRSVASKWLLSGTIIQNKFKDLSNLCDFLGLSLNEQEPSSIKQWREKYYYRVTKDQCRLPLPEKSIHAHFLDMTEFQRQFYQSLYQETAEFYREYNSQPTRANLGILLVKLLRLRQCCNHVDSSLTPDTFAISSNRHDDMSSPKFDKVLSLVQSAPRDDKMIVFSQWSHSLNLLGRQLIAHGISFLSYHGGLSVEERNQVLDDFKHSQSKEKIILMTISAGGVGLDLTCANHVILLDSWWNQSMEEQAIDRVYRIGQTKKVDIHRLYMMNSIEEWMIQLKEEKYKIDATFHAGGGIYQVDTQKLSDLLSRYL